MATILTSRGKKSALDLAAFEHIRSKVPETKAELGDNGEPLAGSWHRVLACLKCRAEMRHAGLSPLPTKFFYLGCHSAVRRLLFVCLCLAV